MVDLIRHPTQRFENSWKRRLNSGECLHGLFLLSGSSTVAEACGTTEIDILVVDMEASPIGFGEVVDIFRALNGSKVAPMVRVASLERHAIEHLLDLGAKGIVVPKIDTQEQAAKVADYALYPPDGTRGVNPVRVSGYFSSLPGYFAHANEEALMIVQIESEEAVENAYAIASVPGIDSLFIGCGDLAMSYHQPGNVTGDKMDKARKIVLEACREYRKIPGIFAYSLDLALQYSREGFRLIAIGNDLKIIKESINSSLIKMANDK